MLQSFGGYWRRYEHASSELGCDMKFHVFIPPATDGTKFPVSTGTAFLPHCEWRDYLLLVQAQDTELL